MNPIEQRLQSLGLTIPDGPTPRANYVPWKRVGSLLYVSGQVPVADGKDQYVGQVGTDLTLEDGQAAARLCALNLLSQIRRALSGDWGRLVSCVRLGGFVNAASGFGQQPQVINGASDLLVQVMGEAGRHTRFAVGVSSLPRNLAVEIDAVFEVRD